MRSLARIRGARTLCGTAALGSLFFAASVRSQPQPSAASSASGSASSSPSEAERKAEAIYKQAWDLEEKGDLEGALDFFRISRRVFPTRASTYNLAHRLVLRGRCDEALETFESFLEDFSGTIPATKREEILLEMLPCRELVGTVNIKSAPGAQITVDGKEREASSRGRAARLLPGKHQIRVYKAGFEISEREVEVRAREEQSIDLPLKALEVGRVWVTGKPDSAGLSVLIDGNEAGVAPWSGSLVPGRYLVQLVGPSRGSLPRWLQVVGGLEAGLELEVEPLGAPTRLVVEPPEALLSLDGETLGPGSWLGRLPARSVRVEASLEGYRTRFALLNGREGGEVRLQLEADRAHERWKQNRLEVEISGGRGWSPSMKGDASLGCPAGCRGAQLASGWALDARVDYVLSSGVRLEGIAGYTEFQGQFERRIAAGAYEYRFQQSPSLRGPHLGAGVGYRVGLWEHLEVGGHLSFHGLFGASAEPMDGSLHLEPEQAEVLVENSNETARGFDLFTKGRAELLYRTGAWRFGIELGAGGFLTKGPTLKRGEVGGTQRDTRPCVTNQEPWCLRARDDVVGSERVHGRFLFLVPSLVIGWSLP